MLKLYMNKSKKPIVISALIIVFLAVILLFVSGINIGIPGVISFTTKYYKTPEEACGNFDSELSEISESVDFIQIDEHNGMFIGKTIDEGTEDYFFVSMQTKNEKYFCSGFYAVVEYPQNSEGSVYQGSKIFLYDDWGRCRGQYEYMLIYDEDALLQLDDSYKTQYIKSKTDNGFYFAFRII